MIEPDQKANELRVLPLVFPPSSQRRRHGRENGAHCRWCYFFSQRQPAPRPLTKGKRLNKGHLESKEEEEEEEAQIRWIGVDFTLAAAAIEMDFKISPL